MFGTTSILAKATIVAVAILVAGVAVASAYGAFIRTADTTRRSATMATLTNRYLAPARAGNMPDGTNVWATTELTRRPLDSDPLTIAGLQASLHGKHATASLLMAEALRRNPRSIHARMWWLTVALRRNDIPLALAQADRLMALEPQPELFFPILTEIARQPSGEIPLRKLLASNPSWRSQFVASLNASGVNSQLVFRLTMGLTASSGAQTILIQKLLDKGDYDGAYLAWVNFLPNDAMGAVAPLYDGGFAGLPGPLPFNWEFNDGQAASVGIEKGRGLQIDYPSAQSVEMAKQLLILMPGAYRIDYVAHGSGEASDGGVVSLRLKCVKGDAVILDVPITGLTDRPSRRTASFVVPAMCRLQKFSIEGTAGIFPATRSITIARLAIVAQR